jgi:hypothetical protein
LDNSLPVLRSYAKRKFEQLLRLYHRLFDGGFDSHQGFSVSCGAGALVYRRYPDKTVKRGRDIGGVAHRPHDITSRMTFSTHGASGAGGL